MPPSQIGSRIIYEDPKFLVIDKPPNLLTHPTGPGGPPTLWDELRHLLAFEIINGGQISLINRLDRETSGLVLVAKSSNVARHLGLLTANRQIQKTYLCIVYEWPEWDFCIVDQPLLRQGRVAPSKIWLKQVVHATGYPAQTEFKVLSKFIRHQTRFALVAATPRTGRTHQIRVHISYLHHPIVGDKIYGPDENCYLEFIEFDWTSDLLQKLLLPRHALHASTLSFDFDGRTFEFAAPLPQDLQDFISKNSALAP